MHRRVIFYVLGKLVMAETGVLCLPLLIALWRGENSAAGCVVAILLSLVVASLLRSFSANKVDKLSIREGVAITALGWMLATFLGMLPYLLSGYLNFLDALFESISGFTGTGATVFATLKDVPQSLLFWRMMTHWLGGLGIIVIFIALLPQAGAGTFYMYKAESTGASDERVLPRLRDMTQTLFYMYVGFTSVAFITYLFCGLNVFDALTHAMSTIGAGGFSTYDDSAMHFESVSLELAMTFFMILAGGSFGLYYRAWHKGIKVLWRDTEFKAYIGILSVATVLITGSLFFYHNDNIFASLRFAFFQVGSLSTTGFVSADYELWPDFAKGILLSLMFVGGCAGSAASGLKVSRLVLLAKGAWAVVRQKLNPRRIITVHMNGHVVHRAVIVRAGIFFFLYVFFIFLWSLLMTADGIAAFDAISIAVATMGNIGPAFGIAGATENYAVLSDFTKSILCVSMLMGRLEMLTILVMFRREFWQAAGHW